MTLPFTPPPWLPWWAVLVLLVVALLWGLAFLMVPFSVIGVKARLEGLEARLDELHAEIRTLALRLPEAAPMIMAFDEGYTPPLAPRDPAPAAMPRRPPVPPPRAPVRREMETPPPRPPRREGRIEPHLDRGR